MPGGSPAYNAGTAKGRAKSERLRKAKAHVSPQPPTLSCDPSNHSVGVTNGGRYSNTTRISIKAPLTVSSPASSERPCHLLKTPHEDAPPTPWILPALVG